MSRRDPATEAQVLAADPTASTWLSANAGSGKTSVLINRVARLLLDGVAPQRILCLTYTKAAAGEMQNRLFERLGEWAMLPDRDLRQALERLGLGKGENTAPTRQRSRTLFARALETPGGLKIQTIHSFCASLLRRFPLEAGVSPRFTEMDARAGRRLTADTLDAMAGGADRATFDAVARELAGTDEALHRLVGEMITHRRELSRPVDAAAIWARVGLAPGFGEADLLALVFTGDEGVLGPALLKALREGSINDNRAAEQLSAVNFRTPRIGDLIALEATLLTGKSAKAPFTAKSGKFPTRATRARLAEQLDAIDALMVRVEEGRRLRLSLDTARRTLALHRFAAAFLPRFEAAKRSRGWLDFDDLILGARRLLTTPAVAQWVLFRLDGGIDHILVDEAQDTSPGQWEVIAALAREFTAGRGAREDVHRTIFVVGDPKQSIYSFQGADPDAFGRMRESFAAALASVRERLGSRQLAYSFRSGEPILALVDQTFRGEAAKGVEAALHHRAFHADKPGRVDLWPAIEKSSRPPEQAWTDPTDKLAETHHAVILAERVADEIQRLIGTPLPLAGGETRPIRAGDFLVLVPRRSALFHLVIRACKSRALPIAGADRLKIAGELAVRDLRALLAFLATPEDDLSLAEALKSPLFGLSETELYRLASDRRGAFLWAALRARSEPRSPLLATLDALLDQTDFLRPYELIERILTRHEGRRRLLARLGPEAEDGIDALLAQALAYEQSEVPSLTGFLGWLDSGEVEIKRQLDAAGDRIRVMSVHGAKGLQSPIVILPDTGKRKSELRDQLLALEGGLIWKPRKEQCPGIVLAALAKALERQEEERRRLLYVAMTRAESWLIVCGAGDVGSGLESWYGLVEHGLQAAGATSVELPGGRGLSLRSGDWSGHTAMRAAPKSAALPDLPDWASTPATPPARPREPLSPSALGGAKVLPGETAPELEDAAKRHGTQVHLLLEHLPGIPPEGRPELARRLLGGGASATDDEISELLAEVEAVLRAPDLAWIFSPEALAEVEIVAQSPTLGAPIRGFIDRLVVTPERVIAIDFKTNRQVPKHPQDTPSGLLRQMGAYGEALAQIYPGREIATALLWTRTATLLWLPHEIVMRALQSTRRLDLPPTRS